MIFHAGWKKLNSCQFPKEIKQKCWQFYIKKKYKKTIISVDDKEKLQ